MSNDLIPFAPAHFPITLRGTNYARSDDERSSRIRTRYNIAVSEGFHSLEFYFLEIDWFVTLRCL